MDTPKPRTEVTQETRETLSVLELDRKPRPEKMAAERAFFDGAHEVRFTERTFRPKHGADLDDVRAFVDSLVVQRREVPPLPEVPKAAPIHPVPVIPDHYRGPLERAISGSLVSVETVHRVGTGTVVDVAWETEAEGLQRGLYLVVDDEARPYTDVASRIDSLPPPAVSAPEPATSAATPAAQAPPALPAEKEKKRFGFGKKKEKPAEPAPAPEAAPPAEEPKRRRFGFGKK